MGQLAYRSDSKGSTRPYKPTPRALEPIDEFFLVLTRLRLGSLEQDLAERFRVSTATISRICTTWIKFLDKQLRPLITWPSRTLIDKHMPSQFRELYPTTRVILDCTEIFTEKPSSLPVQSAMYSTYKHHNTFKGLVGISPVGAITFISELYAALVKVFFLYLSQLLSCVPFIACSCPTSLTSAIRRAAVPSTWRCSADMRASPTPSSATSATQVCGRVGSAVLLGG